MPDRFLKLVKYDNFADYKVGLIKLVVKQSKLLELGTRLFG